MLISSYLSHPWALEIDPDIHVHLLFLMARAPRVLGSSPGRSVCAMSCSHGSVRWTQPVKIYTYLPSAPIPLPLLPFAFFTPPHLHS